MAPEPTNAARRIRRRLDKLLAHADRTADKPAQLREIRIACRRLEAFSRLATGGRRLRARLRLIRRDSGNLRDISIVGARLRQLVPSRWPAIKPVLQTASKHRTRRFRKRAKTLRKGTIRRVDDLLTTLQAQRASSLRARARSAARAAERAVRRILAEPLDDAAFHALRRRVKCWRFALEVESCIAPSSREIRRRITRLQDLQRRMGEVCDVLATRDFIEQLLPAAGSAAAALRAAAAQLSQPPRLRARSVRSLQRLLTTPLIKPAAAHA